MRDVFPSTQTAIFVKGGVIRWMDGGGWKMEGGRVEGGSLVPPSTSTTPPLHPNRRLVLHYLLPLHNHVTH